MSRSYLRDKWMRQRIKGRSLFAEKADVAHRNRHRQDEMPKNQVGSYVSKHCHKCIRWIQEPVYCGGHRIPKGGHRIVSGLVRANVKREIREAISEQLDDK